MPTKNQAIWEAGQNVKRRVVVTHPDEYFVLKPEEVTPEYHAWHKHMRACIDHCGAGQRCAAGQALLDACPLPDSRKAHQ